MGANAFVACDPQRAAVGQCIRETGCGTEVEDPNGEGDLKDSQQMIDHLLIKSARDGDNAGVTKALNRGAYLEARRPWLMAPESAQAASHKVAGRGEGLTPLMYASLGGYHSTVELLLHAKANLRLKDEEGFTALHLAASAASEETCLLLMKHGGQADVLDDDGKTAFDHVPDSYVTTAADQKHWKEEVFQLPESPPETLGD